MLVPVVLLVLALALLTAESLIVRRRVNSISTRVHVNGTRGKSSVTRYIAAGLRAANMRCWGKVTGVHPTIIKPDGSALLIQRRGGARVQEQFRIISRAARDGVQALVLECMSIRPELQQLEGRHFRPHVYILTNVKDDHREALGDSLTEQAIALCSAMAPGSTVITTDDDHLPILREIAARRGNKVIVAGTLSPEQKESLPEGVFAVNVALAVAACRECGVPEKISFPAILNEAAKSVRIAAQIGDAERFHVVDGFAVNDVPSARDFIEYWQQRLPETSNLVVLFNARADRPLRSKVFAEYLPTISNLKRVIVFGTHAPYMKMALISQGYPRESVTLWTSEQVATPVKALSSLGLTSQDLAIGIGNIGGDGHHVSEVLAGEVASAV